MNRIRFGLLSGIGIPQIKRGLQTALLDDLKLLVPMQGLIDVDADTARAFIEQSYAADLAGDQPDG